MAVCGIAEFDECDPPALLNPMVIVEVLSPYTQRVDKGEKASEYRALLSLTDYVLVAQDRIAVTHYARQSETQWLLTDYSAMTDTLSFASVGVSMTLADIYRKVAFAPPAASG